MTENGIQGVADFDHVIYRALLDNIPLQIILKDLNINYLYAN